MKWKWAKWLALVAVQVALLAVLAPKARENRRLALARTSSLALAKEINKATPSVKVVRKLLADGADPNVRLQNHEALWWSVREEAGDGVARLLLDAGVDVNVPVGPDNETALMAAVTFTNVKAVRLLLQRGAKVNIRVNQSATALGIARSGISRYEVRTEDLPELYGLRDARYWRMREIIRLLKAAGAKE